MTRTDREREGALTSGALHWTCGGQPSGSAGYQVMMHEPVAERLEMSYMLCSGEEREQLRQTVRLYFTAPHCSGKR